MAFTTTICPNCERKINKSDLMLVETKIKTRIKCCPHCVKFIDVERQLTLQGRTVHKQDEIEKAVFASNEIFKSAPERSLFQNKKRDLKELKIKGPFYQQAETERPELETAAEKDKKALDQSEDLREPSEGIVEESKSEDTKFELNHLDLMVIKKLRETGESQASVLADLLNEDEYKVFRSLKKLKKFGLYREKIVEMQEIEKSAEEAVELELEEEITVPAAASPEKAEASPISFEKVEEVAEEAVESELEEETPETVVAEEAVVPQAEQSIQGLEVSEEKEVSVNPEKVEEITKEAVEPQLEEKTPETSLPEIELKKEVEEKRLSKESVKAEQLKPEESAVEMRKEIEEGRIEEKPIEKTVKIMKKQKAEEPESLKKEMKETEEEKEKKKKLITSWQSECMVASKEMEDILFSTMAKKESERKKKGIIKQKNIPSSLIVKLKKAKIKKRKK